MMRMTRLGVTNVFGYEYPAVVVIFLLMLGLIVENAGQFKFHGIVEIW